MSDKHAATLAALDAGIVPYHVRYPYPGATVLYRVRFASDEREAVARQKGWSPETAYANVYTALAAAADALGLESRYVVLPRGRCTRCGRYASDERRLTIIFDEETDTVEGIFCADGCGNSEEEKR